MAAIALTDVSVERHGMLLLSGVELQVDTGERLGLLGSSGAGKTALLRVMAGLDEPRSGSVEIGGRPVELGRGEVTMVFQGDALYEHLDVEGNLAFPLQAGPRRRDVEDRIDATARRFLLASVRDRAPGTLSAGQRRLVSAARALSRPDVEVVLLDDALTGTDARLRHRLVETILSDPHLTVVFTTREGEDALRWGDRVAVLADGRIAQVGVPGDVYRQPVSLAVAEAMGELNRIPATMGRDGTLEVGGSRLRVETATSRWEVGRRVVIGIRPSGLRPARHPTPFSRRLRATVGRIEQVGAVQRVLFGLGERGGVAFCAAVEAGLSLSVGDRLDWELDAGETRLYDPGSGVAL